MRTRLLGTTLALVTFGAASLGVAGPAVAEAPPAPATPPAANTFPVPLPATAEVADSWHACRDGCARLHKGNDIFAPEGTPEVAVESGTIARVDDVDDGNGGLSIWLLGDSGVAYYYAHNSANLVVEGQRVGRGQVVGRVGRTGNARTTPAHIHFQVNVCGELTSAEPCTVDPHPLLTSWTQAFVDGGVDSLGWYRPSDAVFRLREEGGSPLPTVATGRPGRTGVLPVAGDWDGDGRDSVAVYDRASATLRPRDADGRAQPALRFGTPGRTDALPVAGDWDGDGRDTVGLYTRADATFRLLDALPAPPAATVAPADRGSRARTAADRADGRR
ncbi:MAG TPA: peptidoglycan DD-metalloendopeptidase family protein, partial [Acidimicrobiales bacterium]